MPRLSEDNPFVENLFVERLVSAKVNQSQAGQVAEKGTGDGMSSLMACENEVNAFSSQAQSWLIPFCLLHGPQSMQAAFNPTSQRRRGQIIPPQ